MARPRQQPGGRTVVVAVRLSAAEAGDLDVRRGSLSRSEYLRFLIGRAKRDGLRLQGTPVIRR